MSTKSRKQVYIDAEIAALLDRFHDLRGVKQTHVLSVSTLFYLVSTDEIRVMLDLAYQQWKAGKQLKFLSGDSYWGVSESLTGPILEGEDLQSMLNFLGMVSVSLQRTMQVLKLNAERIAQDRSQGPTPTGAYLGHVEMVPRPENSQHAPEPKPSKSKKGRQKQPKSN